MARTKVISDRDVLTTALALFAKSGDKAVSFGLVGKETGLAPATLVQRFVSRDALFKAMISQGWDGAMQAFAAAEAEIPANGHNAVAFLKALGEGLSDLPMTALLLASMPDPVLRARASDWRRAVEGALCGRVEKGPGQAPEAAAAIFAAWQGRNLWQGTEGGDFRLRAILKKKQG